MPSPIGHALAGIAVAWTADLIPGDQTSRCQTVSDTVGHRSWFRQAGGRLTVLCAGLAAAPDVDLLFGPHRGVTHSLAAAAVVGVIAALVAITIRGPVTRIASTCAAAYGSHLLLDWLGIDRYPPRGIQLLWPMHDWYISGLDLFRQTARERVFTHGPMMTNIRAILQEIAILGPVLVVLWLIRVKALARLAPEVSGGHHPAK